MGLQISDLTEKLKQDYNLNADLKNPIITAVAANSIASQIGLRVGDVILNVNKVEPTTALQAIKAFKKGTNTLRLARGRGLTAITFDL